MTKMRPGRPIVLLTGFGPFPGMPENASTRLAAELAVVARQSFPSHAFLAAHLPTEWHQGPRRLADLYAEHEPTAAIHFGVSGRASGFEIETRGHNRRAAIADAAGIVPEIRHLDPDGPTVLPSRLPIDRILMALRAHGLPASLSRDAGGYLCNAVLYHASDLCRRTGDVKAGFIHVPASLAPMRRLSKRPPAPSRLAWDDAVLGGLLIIAATLGLSPERRPYG